MNLNNPLSELRDIDVNGKKIVAMQSKNSSKLVYIINNKAIALPINREETFFDGMVLYAQKGMMFGEIEARKKFCFHIKIGRNCMAKAPTPLKALEGEYGFSASGNNIVYKDKSFSLLQAENIRDLSRQKTWAKPGVPLLYLLKVAKVQERMHWP